MLGCAGVAAVVYWALGYGLAYGKSVGGFFGFSKFLTIGMDPEELPGWFFQVRFLSHFLPPSFFLLTSSVVQYTFAATAGTIVSGALAERCEFAAYFAYSGILSGYFDALLPFTHHHTFQRSSILSSPTGVGIATDGSTRWDTR